MFEQITVCIPTYNGAKYIRECLDSVLDQSYFNLEILVVDDCSSDNTVTIVEKYAKYDDRIRLETSKNNLGLVGNWKRCIRLATNDWIKFAFQDDILLTNCIEQLYSSCIKHQTRLGICNRRYVIDSTADPSIKSYILKDLIKLNQYHPNSTFLSKEEIAAIFARHPLLNIFGEPPCYLFRRSLINDIGDFNEDLAQVVDYHFVLKIALQEGISWVVDNLVFFRVHGGNQSNKNKGTGRSDTKRLKIEYVDAVLLLYEILYLIGTDNKLILETANSKYKAEIAKGVNELGLEQMQQLFKLYLKRYPRLSNDLITVS